MPFVERRRFPRIPCPPATSMAMAASVPARILDVSRSGALVSLPCRLEPGARARLQASLGSNPFSAEVEARHSTPGPDKDGLFRLGAVFLALCETSRRALDEFLERRRR
jgi:hypothetical protein